MGSDHPDRRQPRHLHQDRLRQRRRSSECHSTSSIFRGYSDLHEGQGPARRPLHHQPHLRHLRRQPRHLLVLRAEHGVRRQAAAPRRVDHQPRRGRRVHVRPQHLPGEPGRGRLLREDGRARPTPACWSRPTRTEAPARRRSTATGPSPTSCASLNPFDGRVLPRGAAGQPLHARDVLPDGGPPRAPVDALPGRRRHRRRRSSCSPTTSRG